MFDIYASRPFQRHQEPFNARCFGPCCRALNIRESRRTPNPYLFQVLGFTPTLGQSGVVTPRDLGACHPSFQNCFSPFFAWVVLARAKMVTPSFRKRNFMQSWWTLIFFLFLWPGGKGFIVFSPYSQCFPTKFPKGSSRCSWLHLCFMDMVCPKSDSPIYKLKSRGARLFLFCNWGPKTCFYWGHAPCSKSNCWWADQYGSLKIYIFVNAPTNSLIWITHY
jgi:hypothetical protein